LERPDEGEISVSGATVFSASGGAFVPAYKRAIGMVFQSYAIWPHLTVLENVAFPLRVSKERVRGDDVGVFRKPPLQDFRWADLHRSHIQHQRSRPDMAGYGIDDFLQASDRRRKDDHGATCRRLESGERNVEMFRNRLEARSGVVRA
jgi:ABC-type sugar transport system ATPase subunit